MLQQLRDAPPPLRLLHAALVHEVDELRAGVVEAARVRGQARAGRVADLIGHGVEVGQLSVGRPALCDFDGRDAQAPAVGLEVHLLTLDGLRRHPQRRAAYQVLCLLSQRRVDAEVRVGVDGTVAAGQRSRGRGCTRADSRRWDDGSRQRLALGSNTLQPPATQRQRGRQQQLRDNETGRGCGCLLTKSVILTAPVFLSRMFALLMSRWMMFLLCR